MNSAYVSWLFTLLALALSIGHPHSAQAAPDSVQTFIIQLGDYQFEPKTIEVIAGRPVEFTLINMDVLTPHNFTLKASDPRLELETDISPGTSVTVRLTPKVPGTYTFYCNKKLLFIKSHRDRGMEGKLIVRRWSNTLSIGLTSAAHLLTMSLDARALHQSSHRPRPVDHR